jgi:hypothetical protein
VFSKDIERIYARHCDGFFAALSDFLYSSGAALQAGKLDELLTRLLFRYCRAGRLC